MTYKQLSEDDCVTLAHSIPKSLQNTDALASLAVLLLMIAACRKGETVLESQDYFKYMVVKAHDDIRNHWDKMRIM